MTIQTVKKLRAPKGAYIMREEAARLQRCFICSTTKNVGFYWVRDPANPQDEKDKFTLPFCSLEHYEQYQQTLKPQKQKRQRKRKQPTIDSCVVKPKKEPKVRKANQHPTAYAREKGFREGVAHQREQEDTHRHAQEFAAQVGKSIMILLANTPYDDWPTVAKIAYKHDASQNVVGAYCYRKLRGWPWP